MDDTGLAELQEAPAEPVAAADETVQEASPVKEDKVPWDKDPRWTKWRAEEKTLREQSQRFAQENENYKRQLEQQQAAIKEYEAKLKAPQGGSPAKDAYSEYDPLVAQKLRELDELKAQFSQNSEKQEQQQYEAKVAVNERSLEDGFNRLCSDQKLGEPHQQAIAAMTAVALQQMMPGQDIRLASVDQLEEAFKQAFPMLDAVRKAERSGLSLAKVPASGSKTGVAARQETWGTPSERVSELVRGLGG